MQESDFSYRPQNFNAEKAILSGLLFKPERILDVIDTITSKDFAVNEHSEIFDAIHELHADKSPISCISVLDKLKYRGDVPEDMRAMVFEYESALVSGENVNHYAKIIKRLSMLRDIMDICEDTVAKAENSEANAEVLSDNLMKAIGDLSETAESEVSCISDTLEETYKAIVERAENPNKVLGRQSGFYDLDKMVGGFRGGELIILAARPAMGKSCLALEIAKNSAAISGLSSMFFSMEMTRASCEERLLASIGKVKTTNIRNGFLSQDDWSGLGDAYKKLQKINLAIDENAKLTVWDIKRKARAYKYKHGLGLIVIDYLQLMTGNRREQREREVAEISRELKCLSKELDVPIVALSQLNRGLESRINKEPMLCDLRESGAIEQDADVCLFLHRESYYEAKEEPEEAYMGAGIDFAPIEEAKILIRKNRHGATGEVRLAFEPVYTRFNNLSEEPTSSNASDAIRTAAGW